MNLLWFGKKEIELHFQDNQWLKKALGLKSFSVNKCDKGVLQKWWTGWGSNPRPSDCQPDALPAELPAHTLEKSRFYNDFKRSVN